MAAPITAPAFPAGNAPAHSGMSLRAYFMAHAPVEPQPWFRPVMPHPQPKLPLRDFDMTQEEAEDWAGWDNHAIDVEQVGSVRLQAYIRALIFAKKQLDDWQADYRRQSWVQWPAAWADEQLEQLQAPKQELHEAMTVLRELRGLLRTIQLSKKERWPNDVTNQVSAWLLAADKLLGDR